MRFTISTELPPAVHMVSNILEDQRIESLMMEEFAGTRPLIRSLTELPYQRSPELEPTDDPGQVVAAALQHRWAYRLALPLKGELSAVNRGLWERLRPLVERAWAASSSVEVDRIARRIVRMLGLKEHQVPAAKAVRPTKSGPDLVPANIDLAAAETGQTMRWKPSKARSGVDRQQGELGASSCVLFDPRRLGRGMRCRRGCGCQQLQQSA